MHKSFLAAGSLLAGLAVALGAFGAHGLHRLTEDAKIIDNYHTAAQYQMYHAIALVLAAIVYPHLNSKLINWAGRLFIIGIILFSGSLYTITILKIEGVEWASKVGAVAPVGGLSFILGWLLLFFAALQYKKN